MKTSFLGLQHFCYVPLNPSSGDILDHRGQVQTQWNAFVMPTKRRQCMDSKVNRFLILMSICHTTLSWGKKSSFRIFHVLSVCWVSGSRPQSPVRSITGETGKRQRSPLTLVWFRSLSSSIGKEGKRKTDGQNGRERENFNSITLIRVWERGSAS